MAHHVVSVSMRCPRCEAEARRCYVVTTGTNLRASRSIRCEACGFGEEADGELTDEARQAFLQGEGRWELRMKDPGQNRTLVLRILREKCGAAVVDVPRLFRGDAAIIEGILAEVEQVGDELRAAGATVVPKRVE